MTINKQNMYHATKGGFSIIVNASTKDKKRKQKQLKQTTEISTESEKVQKIVDDFLERTRLHILCTEHARALLREGDLFLNVVVDFKKGIITEIKRAPALTMKRNVNEYGNFIDNKKAFSQIDTSQIFQMAGEKAPETSRKDFALYQINHIRWLCDETKIYGTSQYAVARKCYKMLEKMEEALAYRRIYRSVSKRSHKLETTDIAEIEDYKRANAMVDENGTPTQNAHMLTDYIGNVEVSALHDEANLDEIKDVEMIENMLWINLLVPKAIITGGQGINRDVLKVQYPHYLQTLENITDTLEYGDNGVYSGYRAIINLQLLLLGINPENIYYDIVWSRKTEESITERIESIQNAFYKGFLVIFEKGTDVIEKTYDKEKILWEYQFQDKKFCENKKRKQFKKLEKCANKSNRVNIAVTAVEGAGLGLLGIGLPDIPIFLAVILKGIYETALHYGYDYNDKREQIYILRLMRGAMAEQEQKQQCDELVEKTAEDIEKSWKIAQEGGRAGAGRVIVEGFVKFDYEITLLTVRSVAGTSFCEPIGHIQVDGDYRYSWQPQSMDSAAKEAAQEIARKVTDALGGYGIFGVELFVCGDEVIFSEVSPRPHDTGMVTMISQDLSEFALHARALTGLPVPEIRFLGPSASRAVVVEGDSTEVIMDNLGKVLEEPGVQMRIFGKPEVKGHRRMGVILATADSVEEARAKAERAYDKLNVQIL